MEANLVRLLDGMAGFLYYVSARGAVAQLGEYVTGSHGVAGSSPVSSTIFYSCLSIPFKSAPG